ncbi:hypothetical protein [Pseudoflavonifractor sp. An85]|uniref:hypothetical protein n=1 Tax=Pseudoflavonifractor sp. An85 TaxID=1965661 RepID=UPI001302495A|nr:hypothetical protein [Pseudoflavonifractor sp. An85]
MTKFYCILAMAIVGVMLIILSTSILEQILPKPYSLMILIIGFVLAIVALILMKYHKK